MRTSLLLLLLALTVLGGALLPLPRPALAADVTAVTTGGSHTCALIDIDSPADDFGLKCWGANHTGQLGDGRSCDLYACATAVDVQGLSSDVAAVSAGGLHTCAVTTAGGLKCWGIDNWGQLGAPTSETCVSNSPCSTKPVDVSGLTSGVAAVSAGAVHTCALTTAGDVKCWGDNHFGQLGAASSDTCNGSACSTTPLEVTGLSSGAVAVGVGFYHTCALVEVEAPAEDYGLKCWGSNSVGQLGTTDACGIAYPWQCGTPVDVVGLTSGVAAVAVGFGHTCALTLGEGLKCWGSNESGQLGDGQVCADQFYECPTPTDVPGLTSGMAAVAAGGYSTCGLTTAGNVKCWGSNRRGKLGTETSELCPPGSIPCSTVPLDVCADKACVGALSNIAAITAGGQHTCALTTTGGLKCWGDNEGGQLGIELSETLSYPHPVKVPRLKIAHTPAPTFTGLGALHSLGAKAWIQRNTLVSWICDPDDPSGNVILRFQHSWGTQDVKGKGRTAVTHRLPHSLLGVGCIVNFVEVGKILINQFERADGLVDPSGRIFDTNSGLFVAGATVTLEIEDPPDGGMYRTLDPLTDAAIKEPDINPQATGLDGRYAWDVAPGRYRVQVQKAGCTSAASPPVLIPPPITDLDVGIKCADKDSDGLPDYYEVANGLNPNDLSDAGEDPDEDGFTNLEEIAAATDPFAPDNIDSDRDGCTNIQELGGDAVLGGLRDPTNPWDFYDTNDDRIIDLFNDIVGVIERYGTNPGAPWDRGPSAGPYDWSLTAPDGIIDLFNDIVGVIQQFGHDCR